MSKFAVYTLGCKVNQYESDGIIELLCQKGYQLVNFDEFADIYIINTCTVTSIADRKSRQMIRQAKKKNKSSIVVAMGCYSQISPQDVQKIAEVDLIIGTKDRMKIVELIEQFKNDSSSINIVQDIMKNKKFENIPFSTPKGRTRAFLKIQDGCDNFCSYCIIPYTRGPIRSRDIDEILSEVKKLAEQNFKEIVLAGIHVESYGRDLREDIDLVDVINQIDKVDGIERIRLGSADPHLINNVFISKLDSKKICPHFHLSLQSGCDETLKRMNRKYDTNMYRQAVDLLRQNFKDVSITTDIIVGFPGETDQEFAQTLDFVKEINFSQIHVFKYSKRKGTKASLMPNQVEDKVKEERSKELIQLSNLQAQDFHKQFIGKSKSVLFEQSVKSQDEYIEGLTDNYLRVFVKADKSLIGKIVKVKITENKQDYLFGTVEI